MLGAAVDALGCAKDWILIQRRKESQAPSGRPPPLTMMSSVAWPAGTRGGSIRIGANCGMHGGGGEAAGGDIGGVHMDGW